MRVSSSLLCFAALVTSVTIGCNRRSGADTDGLDSASAALIDDDTEASDVDEDLEIGIEESLSGAAEGGEIDVEATADAIAEKGRTNPGVFFEPAGCIVSTRAANVVTHVFTDCTGPYGLVHFTGTVTSTWTKVEGGAQVVHVAKGFAIDRATVDHRATVTFTKASGVYTKTRKASFSGKTAAGRPISRSADWVTVYDAKTRCIARDGGAQTTIGERTWSSSIDGYERCGIGLAGCPKDGTITLTGPRATVVLDFPGGPAVDVSVNGKTWRRPLVCNASAT